LLDKLNIDSKIIYDLTEKDIEKNKNNKNEIFIILFHYLYDNLPKNKYIIYQLEQANQSNFIDNNFIDNIKNSLITFDYSLFNIYNFNKYNDIFLKNKIYYLPLSVDNITYNEYNDDIEFDIIFYGSKNYRRDSILNNIQKKYKIKILHNIFGEDVINLVKKSKIILNIHYYKNANLEISRINEILIYNKVIISELPHMNDSNIDFYKNNIIFIEEIKDDMSNIELLYNKIDYFLNNKNYNNYLKSNNNKLFVDNIFNKSLSYLNKYINLIQKFNMNKEIAVICCNYGNYDINENNINKLNNNNIFDWYYFTDAKINLDNWNVINNDYHSNNIKNVHNNDINRMISKYYKFQSLNINILQKYKYLIWMDTAIVIENKDFVNNIINLVISNNNEIFIFEHYKRDSIKDEFFESMNLYKYKNQNMIKQVKEYIKNGLCDNKLYETGFIVYKNCESIKKLMNDWWNEINLHSYQCQISAPYVFYKNNIDPFILNEFNFKKQHLEGSVWKNNLYGYVKFNHLNNTNCSKIINYNKINGIDNILWINLERSVDRRIYMEKLLNNINIKNTRINAIDGKNNNTKDFLHNIELNRELSNYEIACTLSHIKAINKIKDIDGEYFLILEDDITFDNISIFEENLEDIIKNSPDFDILILYKTYLGKIDNLYVNWNDYYTEYPELNFIGGTVSYIISKKNIINKLNNFPKYINDIYFKFFINNKFDVCDLYIYKFFNTVVYKYNYISTLLEEKSTIHNHEELHKINYLHQMNIIKTEYF
jgi:GR25 family glycosyltransferase involved in LPS biosynthesis